MACLKRLLLIAGLTVTYFVIVTPLAWWAKWRRLEPLAMRVDPAKRSYWVPLQVDSNARTTYLDVGSEMARSQRSEGWRTLVRAYHDVAARTSMPWKWIILLSLLPWARLASAREEADVRSDLYALF